MESRSFPSNFDIAGRYAKHREQHYLRYGEQGYGWTTNYFGYAVPRPFRYYVYPKYR
jgi:hypothetical protein